MSIIVNPPGSERFNVQCDRNGFVGTNGQVYNYSDNNHALAGPSAVLGGAVAVTLPNLVSSTTTAAYCNIILNTNGVQVCTLVAPQTGRDEGKVLRWLSNHAQAHTITLQGGATYNAAAGGHTIATFGGAIENSLTLTALASPAGTAAWYVTAQSGVTFS